MAILVFFRAGFQYSTRSSVRADAPIIARAEDHRFRDRHARGAVVISGMLRSVLAGPLLLALVFSGQEDDRSTSLRAYLSQQCGEKRFTGAVSIQLRGDTVFEAACGLADVEWDARNTVDTKFRAASIAKEFTAAAILLLQQEGRLSTLR